MCGIVGATAQRNVTGILLEGLKRLEYRGYDSAGLAVINADQQLATRKTVGKVAALADALETDPVQGRLGIAHTRWATHGKPSTVNAHPHLGGEHVALVHNGIIENYLALRDQLLADGVTLQSETDTEVAAQWLAKHLQRDGDLLAAMRHTIAQLDGAYALAAVTPVEPQTLVVARSGSPLVIGIGIEENFIASDPLALRQVTDSFIYLEEGDIAKVTAEAVQVFDAAGEPVERPVVRLQDSLEAADKGQYAHYMLKEIFEQPEVLANTLRGRLGNERLHEEVFGASAKPIFDRVKRVQIVACGTSFHAGMIARYWFEDWAGIPANVEVASEFRYRKHVVQSDTLFVTISQSGETADTLAALRISREQDYAGALAICNVANSSLVRESDLVLMTEAGPEIGVASTKAFTTQLVALQLLVIALGRRHQLNAQREAALVQGLRQLPALAQQVLELEPAVRQMAQAFVEKHHALFLGRGVQYPVALEGALKLKEISYIHAEAYPAGELKHGPLALVDSDMPVVAVAPNDELLEKLKSNLQEVRARGGQLFVFADHNAGFHDEPGVTVVAVPHCEESLAPVLYTLPLQLLAYYVAVFKGTDVDQPRNLAKSVTVE